MLVHVCNSITWQVEAGEIGVQGHSQLRGESEDSLGCRRVCLSEAKHQNRFSGGTVFMQWSTLISRVLLCESWQTSATTQPPCDPDAASVHHLDTSCLLPNSWFISLAPASGKDYPAICQGHTIELNHRASFARVSCPLHVFEAYVCSYVDQ